MKKWFLFGTVVAAVASVVLGAAPAVADPLKTCEKKRTVAVGKSAPGGSKFDAKKACGQAIQDKGKAKYGSNYASGIKGVMTCQQLGGMNGDYWQCICSTQMCHYITLEHFDPGTFKPKLNRDPGVSRRPHGSFGTRRASPPSFRIPRMGPKIR